MTEILFPILLWRNAASFSPALPMVPPRPPLPRRLAKISPLSAKRSSSTERFPTTVVFLWNVLLTANALLDEAVLPTALSTSHSIVPDVTALPGPVMAVLTGATADLTSILILRKMLRWIIALLSLIPSRV